MDGCDKQINDCYCHCNVLLSDDFLCCTKIVVIEKNTLHRDLYSDLPLFICVSTLSFAENASVSVRFYRFQKSNIL